MNFQRKTDIEKLEKNLKRHYDHLLKELRGKDVSDPDMMQYNLHSPHTNIDSQELRLAIGHFSEMLKEIKRICK